MDKMKLSANQMYKMYTETGGTKQFKDWLEQAKGEGAIADNYSNADGGSDAPKEQEPVKTSGFYGIPTRNIVIGVVVIGLIGYLVYAYGFKGKGAEPAAPTA